MIEIKVEGGTSNVKLKQALTRAAADLRLKIKFKEISSDGPGFPSNTFAFYLRKRFLPRMTGFYFRGGSPTKELNVHVDAMVYDRAKEGEINEYVEAVLERLPAESRKIYSRELSEIV